jgi:PDZ domain-containing secreted protein
MGNQKGSVLLTVKIILFVCLLLVLFFWAIPHYVREKGAKEVGDRVTPVALNLTKTLGRYPTVTELNAAIDEQKIPLVNPFTNRNQKVVDGPASKPGEVGYELVKDKNGKVVGFRITAHCSHGVFTIYSTSETGS